MNRPCKYRSTLSLFEQSCPTALTHFQLTQIKFPYPILLPFFLNEKDSCSIPLVMAGSSNIIITVDTKRMSFCYTLKGIIEINERHISLKPVFFQFVRHNTLVLHGSVYTGYEVFRNLIK